MINITKKTKCKLCIIIFTIISGCNVPITNRNINTVDWNTIFVNDSGIINSYYTKKIFVEFNHPFLKDSINFNLSTPKIKYYRDEKQNVFVGCISNYYGTQCTFFEISLIKGEINNKSFFKFSHGNANCCTSENNNFLKFSTIYTFEGCETGSGYCGTRLYFFKNIDDYNEQNSIFIRAEVETYEGAIINLKSKVKIKNDSVQISYTLENFIPETPHSSKVIQSKNEFIVKGFFIKDELYIPDSTEIKKNHLDVPW
jgi:hypothetical protein